MAKGETVEVLVLGEKLSLAEGLGGRVEDPEASVSHV